MENSYIKIYRGLIDWEWFNDSKVVHLFIYLLLKANFLDGKFKGHEVKRGQLITGRKKLSVATGISESSIRTCLDKLQRTNEITITSTSDYSVVTIVKYDIYQCYDKKVTNKTPTKTPTDSQQVATIEEGKKGTITDIVFSFEKTLVEVHGCNQEIVTDWLKVRKTKKATNTKTALDSFIGQVIKTKFTVQEIVKMCVEKSWSGFNHEWVKGIGIKPANDVSQKNIDMSLIFTNT